MRLLPTSVQSFKTLRENGYLYVVYAYGNESFTSETDVVIFR